MLERIEVLHDRFVLELLHDTLCMSQRITAFT